MWEFPILVNGLVYASGLPGDDRVVFSSCPKTLCGVITHRKRANNRLQGCTRQLPLQTIPEGED